MILLVSLLAACSSSPFEPLPVDPDVCLISAEDSAGETATGLTEIELLERYYGVDGLAASESDRQERLFMSGDELKVILEERDFTVFSFSGSLREEATGIIDNLDAGRPLLILLDSKEFGSFWVFLVGYGKDGEFLVVQRPDLSLMALMTEDLLPWWQETEQLTVLAVPSQLVGE